MWTMFFWGMEDELLSQLFCFSCLLLLTTPLLVFCLLFAFVLFLFCVCFYLLLLTTPLPAFWPDFYISFICELSTVGGGRRGILLSLYTSILTTLDHFGYFHIFRAPVIMLMLMMMAMTMFVHQCLPMIIPLCLLASQSYAAT